MTSQSHCSITALERNLAEVETYVGAKAAASAQTDLGHTSEFWRGTFAERPNFPSIVDFLGFRRGRYGYGMADERQGSLSGERKHAEQTFEIFRQSASCERVVALDESALGAPYVFHLGGVHRSAAFWTNAVTSLRVQDILRLRGSAEKPLHILEIGAGWGCMAHQLHQLLAVQSYTIVDLPENLTLSSTYLASTLMRPLQLGPELDGDGEPAKIVCALPGDAPRLTRKFDLIVNSFSLQEMELSTVRGYFSWIAEVLAPDGIFISFNSHGKSGVRAPSDYPIANFQLQSLCMFRAYPSGLLNTIPYEMVLSRAPAVRQPDLTLLDTIGCLMQFGLGDDLAPISDAYVRGALAQNMANALRDLRGYFSTSRDSRIDALQRTTAILPKALSAYLRGLDAYACKDWMAARPHLEEALESGLRGFARLRAAAHLAILTKSKTLPGWTEDFDARLAYPDLAEMLDKSDPDPFIRQFERIVAVELPSRLETA